MRTALTVITTAILTAIAFLLASQQGWLGNIAMTGGAAISPDNSANVDQECITNEEGVSCTTPRGASINHAQAILSFKSDIASGDVACEGITSICNNGAWLNDQTPYAYETCVLEGDALTPKNCPVGEVIVAHDSTNTFYKEIKNGASYTYESQSRYCFDGELDGDPAYTKLNLISSCTLNVVEAQEATDTVEEVIVPIPAPVVTPTTSTPVTTTTSNDPVYARCTAPSGAIWTHGQGGSAYLQSNVGYGSTCESTSIVCGFGSIRYGSAENMGEVVGQTMYSSCSVGTPVGCTSACGDVAHEAKVTTYTNGSLNYSSDKTCNDVKVVSTCLNGSLSPSAGNACSCEVLPPAACTAPNGQQVAHGSSITLYKDATIQPVAWDGSDTCIREGAKCQNGVFYDYNGNPTTLTFKHASCTILPPPSGEGPGGEGTPQG